MSKRVNRVSYEKSNTGIHNASNNAFMSNPNPFIVDLDDPVPEPKRYINRDEYEANELVQTVRELLNDSHNDIWIGTASELLAAARAKMRLNDTTARQIGQEIDALENFLRIYDNIYSYTYRVEGKIRHAFCAAKPDEDGGW